MKCFSERLLSPFRGIANVIDTGEADAVSRDGLNWELYIHGEIEEEIVIDGKAHPVTAPDTRSYLKMIAGIKTGTSAGTHSSSTRPPGRIRR